MKAFCRASLGNGGEIEITIESEGALTEAHLWAAERVLFLMVEIEREGMDRPVESLVEAEAKPGRKLTLNPGD